VTCGNKQQCDNSLHDEIVRALTLLNQHGEPRVDLRIYFLDDDNQWQPTKKGLSLPFPTFRQLQPLLDEVSRRLADDPP
jgi:hypothetical protein